MKSIITGILSLFIFWCSSICKCYGHEHGWNGRNQEEEKGKKKKLSEKVKRRKRFLLKSLWK